MAKKETGLRARWQAAIEWMRQRRRLSIALGIVLIVVLAIVVLGIRARNAALAAQGELQIATIERGSLTAVIGATGSVRANQSATLSWETSGIVDSVDVEVGDRVQTDAVLASLKLDSLPQSVILAQSDLQNALDQMDSFEDSFGALGLAEAEKALADAQDAYEDAQRTYNYTVTVAPQVDIDQAFSDMILAKDQLEQAQDRYEPYANKQEDNLVRATRLGKLAQAQEAYDDAVRLYNIYSTPGNPTEIAIAEAELALAEAQLEAAQQDYDEVVSGPSEQELAAAQARVAAAEATIGLATIDAPFAGVVTDAYPVVGDLVSGGVIAFQLDDLSRLLVDVEVSEVDINRVAIGQDAVLTFDAAPDMEYHGTVDAVALAGDVSEGAVNFRVTVELTDADEFVRPGMTAAVNVVVTQLDDVLLVPNRGVRLQDGRRVVYVLNANGLLQPVTIVLGASSETYSEVVGGDLQEGDQVVLNPPTVTFDPSGGPPPAFMQQGGGGFQ
jgi:HlyD family secretion protein